MDMRTIQTSIRKTLRGGGREVELTGRFPANLLVSGNILDTGEKIKSHASSPEIGQRNFHFAFRYGKGQTNVLSNFGDEIDFSDYFSLDRWFRKQLAVLPPETRQQILVFFDDWL